MLGSQERSLLPDEKVADVMSKWDKFRSSANASLSKQSRHHMFLFKKHLFLDEYIDLTDPVEKELLYYQVLCDLRSDRFPVTDMEAVSSKIATTRQDSVPELVLELWILIDTKILLAKPHPDRLLFQIIII